MIQTYFTQIKRIIEQYATTSFVLEAQMHFDMRPGDQGYLTGTLIFVDDSKLHFSEYLDQAGEAVDKLMWLILDSRVVDVRIVYTDAIPCLKP